MSTPMRAIVKPTAGPGLIMTKVPKPHPGVNDVLIKIRKTSICGTDVHINKWDSWAQRVIKPPLVIGHEYGNMTYGVYAPELEMPDRQRVMEAIKYPSIRSGLAL